VKRVDITFPEENRERVEEVIEEYGAEPVFSEVEKDGRSFLRCEIIRDSAEIDELLEEIRGITDIDQGDLLVEVLEQTTHIEKGKRHEGGSSSLSLYEMYTKAFSFTSFEETGWALILLSAIIAVIGLATNNMIVVVGAMVIAPMLGPFIANSFGLVVGDKKIIEESMLHGASSVLMAVATAFLIGLMLDVNVNPLIQMISEPGPGTVPLSLAVGSASALAFSTDARETLAGVAVAIALVPPSAVAGLMLASLNFEIFVDVSLVIVSNIMSLVFAGSATFKLLGVKPRNSYRREISRQKLKKSMIISSLSILVVAGSVGYMSYQDTQKVSAESIGESVEEQLGGELVNKKVEVLEEEVNVSVVVTDRTMEEGSLEAVLERSVDRDVNVEMMEIVTR